MESTEPSARLKFLADILERSSQPFVAAYMDGRIIAFNQSLCDLLGLDNKEVAGLTWDYFVPSAVVAKNRKVKHDSQRTGAAERHEKILTRRDGRKNHLEILVHLLPDRERKEIYYYAFVTDITARRRAESIQSAMLQISQAVHTVNDLDELYGHIHNIINALMPARNLYIANYNAEEQTLSFPYWADEKDERPSVRPLTGKGLTEYVIRTGNPLLVSGDQEFQRLRSATNIENVGSPSIDWLGVPLKVRGKIIGVLTVQSYDEGVRYTEQDRHLLEFVSEQVAMAIESQQAKDVIRHNEARYRTIFEAAPVSIWEVDYSLVKKAMDDLIASGIIDVRAYLDGHPDFVVDMVKSIRPIDVNEWTLRLYEVPSKDVLFENLTRTFTLEELESFKDELIAIAQGKPFYIREGINQTFTGRRINILLSIAFSSAPDDLKSVMLTIMDITETKKAEAALRESEERYALAVRGAQDAIWDWDLKNDRVYYSPRWKRFLGYREDEVTDSPDEWLGRVHPDDAERLRSDINMHLQGLTPHLENEHRVHHRDGSYRWVLARGVSVRDAGQVAHRMAGSLTDITARKITEERLLHDAMHDPLTNLPNRSFFLHQLHHTIERAKRRSQYLSAMLFLDLDRFKIVNDSLGHAIGDQLLIEVGQRLQSTLRMEDMIARFGGDEFAILLEDINSPSDAIRIAGRIQQDLSMPFSIQGHEIFTDASIGVALTSTGYDKPEEMLRDADTALYRAKAMGRGRHQVFDAEMHAQSMEQLRLEMELRRALEREEFFLEYQPIISLIDGRVTTLEALVRWQHPQRGVIQPDDFIKIAEETGLIVPLGEWVLQTACRQATEWEKAGFRDLKVAVNISARQLQDSQFLNIVSRVLEETGVNPLQLQFEITESAAMQEMDLTIHTLTELHKRGVLISIDDFGTSYSSLLYLKRFPVSSIKIDQSFIHDISGASGEFPITTAIIAMGHILGLSLIAEGVETQEQFDFLVNQRCDEIQGFIMARPTGGPELEKILKKGRIQLKARQVPGTGSQQPQE